MKIKAPKTCRECKKFTSLQSQNEQGKARRKAKWKIEKRKKGGSKESSTFFCRYQKPSYLCNPKSGEQKPKGATPGGNENKIVKQLNQKVAQT